MIILVSGSTRTRARLQQEYPGRLGILTTPRTRDAAATVESSGLLWAADNAAYSDFDASAYRRMLKRFAGMDRCLFVAVPDEVGNAQATHFLFEQWWDEVSESGLPLAYVAQNGAEYLDLPWGHFAALFIGGSTEWKLSRAAADLCVEARARGKWLHIGRVNKPKRLSIAFGRGADSIDGSGMSRFGDKVLPVMLRHAAHLEQQGSLFNASSFPD